jgi:protein gp37
MDPEWVEEIEALCRRYDTAFFFRQWGGVNKKAAGRKLRGRTYDEFPRLVPFSGARNQSPAPSHSN